MLRPYFLSVLFAFLLSALPHYDALANTTKPFTIVEQKEHDTRSFTQGLFYHDKQLYESSGLYGRSFVFRYDERTNQNLKLATLPKQLFAEGLTLFNNELYLLTWQAGLALVLDPESLQPIRKISYAGQGWGLTHDGQHFISSDGSTKLSYRDSTTFKVMRTIEVHNGWRKYNKLNELEYAEGAIWANVWQSPMVLKISPADGKVLQEFSLQSLVDINSTRPQHTVLNGIAYDPQQKAFWVTGKHWPNRYLIRFNNAP